MERLTPLQALWGFIFIIALSPIAGKLGVGEMSPSFLLVVSSLITVLFYVPYITKKGLWKRFFDRDVFYKAAFIGLVGTALPFLLLLIALKYTTPANSAILNQFEVVYSLLLCWFFLKEKPTLRQLAGTVFVVLGTGFILTGEHFTLRLKGDIIVICTVWMFQLSHIAAKKLPEGLGADFLSCSRALFAFLWGIPLAAFMYLFMAMPFNMDFNFRGVLVLFFMGVIRCAAGNAMWYRAIRSMDISKATALALSYPVFTYIFSLAAGYDALKAYQAAGLVFALLGAYMVNDSIKKVKKG
jgi:drug/metabolite transporter (DMT)-like permease